MVVNLCEELGDALRERERSEREGVSPAPWLEEPEPDAIGMATMVSGSGVDELPVGLR
jgi:hypothetical protein